MLTIAMAARGEGGSCDTRSARPDAGGPRAAPSAVPLADWGDERKAVQRRWWWSYGGYPAITACTADWHRIVNRSKMADRRAAPQRPPCPRPPCPILLPISLPSVSCGRGRRLWLGRFELQRILGQGRPGRGVAGARPAPATPVAIEVAAAVQGPGRLVLDHWLREARHGAPHHPSSRCSRPSRAGPAALYRVRYVPGHHAIEHLVRWSPRPHDAVALMVDVLDGLQAHCGAASCTSVILKPSGT